MGHLSINPNILDRNLNHFILWFIGCVKHLAHFLLEPPGAPFLASFARSGEVLYYYGRRLAMPLDWSACPSVESVPGKLSGAWVLRGTRIPVSAVFENLEDGLTVDGIVQMFDG